MATVAFGQSFQITPIQMAATVSSLVNGGKRIIPHIGVESRTEEGEVIKKFSYKEGSRLVDESTSETLQYLLEQVVDGGTGSNGYVEGYRVGGKTATSQTLPRGSGKYIASFIGFAPADDPKILANVRALNVVDRTVCVFAVFNAGFVNALHDLEQARIH
ncbi:MAG: hypothetical protein IJ937_03165, partial [Treponema sp.]|nr:hypothetical protein [Treponema sp.]